EALQGAHERLRTLRQRMVEWATSERPSTRSEEAEAFDRRFREALGKDLDLPAALVVLNEVVTSALPEGERFALLSSWDGVLGLDLERLAREDEPLPPEVIDRVRRRDEARAKKDYAASDALRTELIAL